MATDVALGKAFDLLFDLVKQAIVEVVMFKSTLNKIKSKLEYLEPVIRRTTELMMALDQNGGTTENLQSLIKEGQELIGICVKVKKWMLWKKGKYCGKLREFNEKLQEEIQALPVEIARDSKQILFHVREIERDGKESLEIVRDLSRNGKETSMVIRGLSTKSDETFGLVQEMACDQKETSELVQEMALDLKEVLELNKAAKESNVDEFLDSCEVPKLPQFTVGLDTPLEELKTRLLEGGISVLVVTALGGCGKTTLAIKFCHDDRVKGSFQNILFVNVSKTPTLIGIARVISQHKGHHLPPLLDEANAIKYIEELPEQNGQGPILLVLDDAKLESQSILSKVCGLPDYKILVTSRTALRGFQAYPLRTLNDKDAMCLFRHSASLEDGSSDIPEDLVKKIVEHCKEFPLALEVVGKSLREQPPEIWLKKLHSTLNSEDDCSEDVLCDCLQSCLDDLKSVTLKECFVDLGLFPEDQRIPAAALIDIWLELYGKENDCLAIGELLRLTSHGLANLVVTRKDTKEMDGYYSEHFVTIHDLLRELAILQDKVAVEDKRKRLIIEIKGNSFPKWWKELKQQPINARLLSISTDDKFSSKWCDMHVPQAEVLVLNFRTKNYTLPVFVDKMGNLKVLVITNYGIFPAELRNFHMLGSLTDLKRIRLERISIPSLIKTPVLLNNLQKISFFMCSIGQAFSKVSISKLFPYLEELNIDFCNDLEELPAGLCDLVLLKKLSITHCHRLSSLPKEIGNLESLEVLRLRSSIDLSELPDSICKLYKLNFLDISNCISLRSLSRDIGELSNLRTINMTDCSRVPELPSSILDLENLQLVLCDEEVKELWEKYLPSDSTSIELKVTHEEINLNWLRNLSL